MDKVIYINGILASLEDRARFKHDVLTRDIDYKVYRNKQGIQFIWTE